MNERTRLMLPLKFRSERAALDAIKTNSLFPIGAQAAEQTEKVWRVIIDTYRPEAVMRYLAQHMPGIQWEAHATD
jgi:hypothetical protein